MGKAVRPRGADIASPSRVVRARSRCLRLFAATCLAGIGCGGGGAKVDGAAAEVSAGSDAQADGDAAEAHPAAAGCTYDVDRALGLDETSALGATPRELGGAFGIGSTWACDLSWAPLGDPAVASWAPHDAATHATLTLAWGSGAREKSGGHAPPGVRMACPSSVALGLAITFATTDGGFDETWNLDGVVSQFARSELSVRSDLRAAGLYSFHGSYRFSWAMPWPVTRAFFELAIDDAGPTGAAPLALEGALIESTQREIASDGGVASGTSGDGVIVKVAAWTCAPVTN
jgi:hypothetical protein